MLKTQKQATFILAVLKTFNDKTDLIPEEIGLGKVIESLSNLYRTECTPTESEVDNFQSRFNYLFTKVIRDDHLTSDFIWSLSIHFSRYFLDFVKNYEKMEAWDELLELGKKYIQENSLDDELDSNQVNWSGWNVVNEIKAGY